MQNSELLQKLFALVKEERRIGAEILELLLEIERRKAYAELGYDGLFSFCVKELRYSEAQAYRRIQAMRALQQNPELKQQIESGAMTVTTVSQVQTFITQQQRQGTPLERGEAKALFSEFENKSSREVEEGIQALSGIDPTVQKLQIELDAGLAAAWAEAKNLSAHRTRGQEAQILRMLLDEWLERHRPDRRRTSSSAPKVSTETTTETEAATGPEGERTLSARLRRAVWARDGGRCQNCGSRFAVQIDHIHPISMGGGHGLDNLRLLCRSCNLAAGIRQFGPEKMRRTG